MRLAVAYPGRAAGVDGVRDHTEVLLHVLLDAGQRVRILSADWKPLTSQPFEWAPVLAGRLPWVARRLAREVIPAKPDWLLLQYSPFAYGRWGLNPFLLRQLRRCRAHGIEVALLVHETYPPISGPVRSRALALAQRKQFVQLSRASSLVLFAVEEARTAHAACMPGVKTGALPVWSNLPEATGCPTAVRRDLGIGPHALVIGLFSRLGSHRSTAAIEDAVTASMAYDATWLYVGPDVSAVDELFERIGARLVSLDSPSPQDAANAMASCDLAVAPFVDGVSMRRSSFLAWLQLGVATLTTSGPLTGDALHSGATNGAFYMTHYGDRAAFVDAFAGLCASQEQRETAAARGRVFYEVNISPRAQGPALLHLLSDHE